MRPWAQFPRRSLAHTTGSDSLVTVSVKVSDAGCYGPRRATGPPSVAYRNQGLFSLLS